MSVQQGPAGGAFGSLPSMPGPVPAVVVAQPETQEERVEKWASALADLFPRPANYVSMHRPARTLIALADSEAAAVRPVPVTEDERRAWDEGYAAATKMAKGYGHVDYWEDEPENPYAAAPLPVVSDTPEGKE